MDKIASLIFTLVLALFAVDAAANNSKISHSLGRVAAYGKEPVKTAESLMTFLDFRK